MFMFRRILNWRWVVLVGSLVSIMGLVAACGGASAAANSSASSDPASSNGENITAYVFTDDMGIIKGPDGQGHDVLVPSNFVVQAGTPVHLKVINYDDMSHSITAPDMNLNLIINPATDAGPVTTDLTFTPTTKGTFRWHCDLKCDPWSMSDGYSGPGQEGFMAGFIVVQ